MYAVYVQEQQSVELHLLWLDLSRFPHHTGQVVQLHHSMQLTHVALWSNLNKQYRQPYSGDPAPDEEETKVSIIGPTTSAFPLDRGWYMQGHTPKTDDGSPRKLSQLTIHEMCTHLTERLFGDERPNCETNWQLRWPRQFLFKWSDVWRSIGTPISDPTEENAWRRLLHRNIASKNRFPNEPDPSCRHKCGCQIERMTHTLNCMYIQPLWNACMEFCERALGNPRFGQMGETHVLEAVIFNVHDSKLVNETTRAFLRHAVGQWYADITKTALEGATFVWQHTYLTRTLAHLNACAQRHSDGPKPSAATTSHASTPG